MYEAFYGLKERPFELTPNPRFLCRTPRHKEALSNLQYGLSSGRGITLLLGEAGTGKTTLIRAAIGAQSSDSLCVTIANPTLSRPEFYHYLAGGFRLSGDAATSKSVFLRELDALLRKRHERGAVTALVVDEAQSLPIELLEEVRLLANIETNEDKLLPLILAGQPELAARLNDPSLRQLKQRIALRCELRPFNLEETATYIAGRIRVAGGDSAQIFTREAVYLIYERSGGIPRTISVVCDNALTTGFAATQRPVKARLVAEVCADFDLQQSAAAAVAPASRFAQVANRTAVTAPQDVTPGARDEILPAKEAAFERDLVASQNSGKRRRFVFF